MNIILFGFKKCGKSYWGKRVALELNKTFIDTDDLIEVLYEKECKEKLSCSQIYSKRGEEFFRCLEKRVILSLQDGDAVIAVGGGAVLDPESLHKLETIGKMVYLQIDKEQLKQRMADEIPSYLDKNNFDSSFEKMYVERKKIYEKIKAIYPS